jgi:enoyl-CoA hydratase/carnithine racemase
VELTMKLHRIALPASLTIGSLESLAAELDRAASAADATVWLLHGTRGTFCRGMDLGSLSQAVEMAPSSLRKFAGCLSRLQHASRPTIALVEGEALGGGVGLAAACDVVVATEGATFGLPEALFGLLPAAILPVLMERMTPQKARLFTMLGSSHSASWAAEQGLVDALIGEAEVERAVAKTARDLGRVAPERLLGLRRWIYELGLLEPDAAVARGAALTAGLVCDRRVQDAVSRFVEDGTPPWVNR